MSILSLAVCACWAGSALAATPRAGWTIDSFASPTVFSEAGNAHCVADGTLCERYVVTATNAGSVATDGSAAVLTDTLPSGLSVKRVQFRRSGYDAELPESDCVTSGSTVRCSYTGVVAPDERLTMNVSVLVEATAAKSLANSVSVSGGGVTEALAGKTNENGSGSAPFGVSSFDFYIDGLDGTRDTQAGDHPYELTTTIDLNSEIREAPQSAVESTSVQDVKDVVVDTPVGFVGSILAAPQCTLAQLSGKQCPSDTIIGHLLTEPENSASVNGPIYNLVPERGYPAEFGYIDILGGSHAFYVKVVPTAHGYVLESINPDIPQIPLTRIIVTFYGDPAVRDETGNAQIPFFTNPTNCSGEPVTASIHMDSWTNPGSYNADGSPNFNDPKWVSSVSESPPVSGCNALQFTPEIGAQPTTSMADTPSGMEFEIKVPQSETAGVHATPTLKKAVVTLPEGFTVDPSAGDGLAACSLAQIGWVGPGPLAFDPSLPACPEASKIGSLELESPLLPNKLQGAMYLASQDANPFGTTLAAYVVVDDPVTGVLIKIAGKFLPDLSTGRMTAVFDENPNLPFSDLKLHFFGGPRAELATPESCGAFTTHTELTPWSAPDSGPIGEPFDTFLIDEACPTGSFSPSFTAGSTNLQAGAYTPFVASFSRSDSEQELAGLTVTLPPGLSANVSSIPQCSDAQIAQAEAGTGGCPESTQIGTVRAGVGPGPDPFFATGKAYWTGPYNGGAFGLAVVVPAVAGPFNFGTVMVRQSIRLDPLTAQVTDVSDPFPTIIDGIPLRMRRVDVEFNRPGFTFNPTDCSKMGFTGSVSGSPLGAPRSVNAHTVGYATQTGATSSFSTPFQVTNCATLGFKPQFSVSTSGKTSRQSGASLHVKLVYPKAPFGSQANIGKVKVDLPKQLPSRLTTLQKACPDSVFNANPAACGTESRIGTATATTPILPVSLNGPVYFVSHGGAKFPELIIVLQGYGVTVQLHSETFISKAGITSSTFRTIPDVPVGTFELTLPQGPFSALSAPGNLCKVTRSVLVKKKVKVRRKGQTRTVTRKVRKTLPGALVMPTAFTAQNGATIRQNTPISVTGCGKAKPKKKKGKAGRRHKHGKKK